MMYVEFMKNSHLTDSNKLMAVRLISASSDERGLILLSRQDAEMSQTAITFFESAR